MSCTIVGPSCCHQYQPCFVYIEYYYCVFPIISISCPLLLVLQLITVSYPLLLILSIVTHTILYLSIFPLMLIMPVFLFLYCPLLVYMFLFNCCSISPIIGVSVPVLSYPTPLHCTYSMYCIVPSSIATHPVLHLSTRPTPLLDFHCIPPIAGCCLPPAPCGVHVVADPAGVKLFPAVRAPL